MKRYILFLMVILFLTGCGAGGGGGEKGDENSGGDNGTGNKTNPVCSSKGRVAKIKIKEDGLYRLTYLNLYDACLDFSSVDSASIKITNQGVEIAMDVVDKNRNGSFDDGDYIEFYGKAISRGDERFRFTETNVYWLSTEDGARKRIEMIQSNPNALKGQMSFLKLIHSEEDTWYEQKNYPEVTSSTDTREHWFWGEVFYTPGIAGGDISYYRRDYNFSTRYIDQNRPVDLKLRLQSVSGSHHIKAYVNRFINPLPFLDKIWNNSEPYEIDAEIPARYLINGPNILTLESIGDTTSGIYEIFYLDWFEVQYSHIYQAEHDILEFTGTGLIELSNFTTSDISIYEISDHYSVKKIGPLSIEPAWEPAGTGFKAVFSSPGNSEGHFLALTNSQKKSPVAIEGYTSVGLGNQAADYVIITHEDFYDAIKILADYRNGQGYKVLTVKVQDIYDEFSYGIETPRAIKAFLTYAYNTWSIKPRYVLIVGDATIDYKDISGYGEGYGVKSYVPAYLYNFTGFGEVPSDNWFVDIDDNVLPEMNIGRIPVKSPADVSAVINKIISHETSIYRSNRIVLIADHDPTYIQPIFEELSESTAGLIPEGYDVLRLYQREYLDNFRAGIISSINSGSLIVNYTGHGSVVDWTKDDAFSSEDIVDLTNKGIYPFVVALNCLNGYFVLPDDGVSKDGNKQYPSIAETFLLSSEKGAVAVWAASAIGYPSEHDPLAQALYSIIFKEGGTVLGDAVTMAKKEVYNNGEILEDVVETFIFFGDPATRLK